MKRPNDPIPACDAGNHLVGESRNGITKPSEAPTEELTEATTEAPTEATEPTEPPHSYTEQLWWDTEEKVAQICAEANAYIASIGCTVEPTAGCWDAPAYTREYQSTEAWLRQYIWDFIDYNKEMGLTRLYVTYEPYLDGWYVIVKYAI